MSEPQARPRTASSTTNSANRTSFFSNLLGKPSANNTAEKQSNYTQSPSRPTNEFGATPRESLSLDQGQPLNDEIKSVVNLIQCHARKVYFSGPLVRRIERGTDGSRPQKDEGWKDVWAQLSGTTLSIWDMRAIEEASRQGKEVPPVYINIIDAFFHVLGSVTIPANDSGPAQTYANVLTLNTAGANLTLFSAPSPAALISWVSAFRLASWEKSRLEELYTAHLIRVVTENQHLPSSLVKGRLEGWMRVRLSGHRDWKNLWMVISAAAGAVAGEDGSMSRSESPNTLRKSKGSVRTSLFGGKGKNAASASISGWDLPLPVRPEILFFANQPSSKGGPPQGPPVITMVDIHQAFAVYPERPDLITKSALMKFEGALVNPDGTGTEGWIMLMPESEPSSKQRPIDELLKHLSGVHDAFGLYGRIGGRSYSWDPRDPTGMMFGYPVGPHKDLLFLDRESAEQLDPRDDRPRAVRMNLTRILLEKMRSLGTIAQNSNISVPQLPPMGFMNDRQPLDTIKETPSPATTLLRNGTATSVKGANNSRSETITSASSQPVPPAKDRPVDGQFLQRGVTESPLQEHAELPSQQPPLSSQASSPQSVTQALPGPNRYSQIPRNPIEDSLPSSQRPSTESQTLAPNRYSVQAPVSAQRQQQPIQTSVVIPPLSPKQNARSALSPASAQTSNVASSIDQSVSATTDGEPVFDESAALYYMQHLNPKEIAEGAGQRRYPTTITENTEPTSISDGPASVKRNQTQVSVNGPDGYHNRASASLNSSVPENQSLAPTTKKSVLPVRGDSINDTADALAALSYLDQAEEEPIPAPKVVHRSITPPAAAPVENRKSTPGPEQSTSSFALSKQAAERKVQQANREAAQSKPGRPAGQKKASRNAWHDDDDDEEEEEEDEDEEDEDEAVKQVPASAAPAPAPLQNVQAPQALRPTQAKALEREPSPVYTTDEFGRRMTRNLPSVPGVGGTRQSSTGDAYDSRRRTNYEQNTGGSQLRNQADHLAPGTARQNMWSQVLEPGASPQNFENSGRSRDTFIQMEPQSEMMTKAFNAHGLLSAGLQDKQDRSAKEQEKIARETGTSLVNVESKPPPPQTGLLGAITAHERERKREGGVGAALTERERERRNAEERQRIIDEHQKNQLDMIQNGGSVYGSQYNPMMMNPYMNPMMAGFGYPGLPMMSPMMGGGMQPPQFNPQHLFAAQAAAASAYQQAMYAFSQAGSVVGGENNGDQPTPGNTSPPPGANSMMSGLPGNSSPPFGSPPMANPMMMDPRFSYFGMGMGGMPQMGSMQGLQPQGTGNSGVSGQGIQYQATNLQPPHAFGSGSNSHNASPRGSPAPRSNEQHLPPS